LSAPYQAFETKDGWITLGASNQKTWQQFLDVLKAPDIAGDPRFADNTGRMANLPALIAALAPHFKRRPTADWLDLLEKAGVPAGPVLSITEMHAHPQTMARHMVPVVEHATAGTVRTIGLPVKFSATPGAITCAAPVYGQHTREMLTEAGYPGDEIDDLFRGNVVAEPAPPEGAGKE
jgi:crotonobetainyl-CoA:carnitine CoA-transferase CaiB-like acyl-CoA transferase